jgi:catechol 2,3-dioxygenase-like lactoylglutathione lyase family enzyme
MPGDPITGVALDHVAHAVPRWQDVWDRYAVDFGAEWSSGGPGPGFAPAQLQFANGARVEVLMPNDPHVNDFLQRFLARNGSGAHHLTFKVPHLPTAIDQARRSGFEPIGIDLSDPEWMEAFLHPAEATGVVVQLAEAPYAWSSPPPSDYPRQRRQRKDGSGPVPPSRLTRIVHAVADLSQATALFVDLLGATSVDRGTRPDHRWLDLDWGSPLRLRLISPTATARDTALTTWLGGRSGRVHHLELVSEEPETLVGARQDADQLGLDSDLRDGTYWVIPPGANAGLGLVVLPA